MWGLSKISLRRTKLKRKIPQSHPYSVLNGLKLKFQPQLLQNISHRIVVGHAKFVLESARGKNPSALFSLAHLPSPLHRPSLHLQRFIATLSSFAFCCPCFSIVFLPILFRIHCYAAFPQVCLLSLQHRHTWQFACLRTALFSSRSDFPLSF